MSCVLVEYVTCRCELFIHLIQMVYGCLLLFFFFFQAEDGIRDAQESRGLGDVYKRQELDSVAQSCGIQGPLYAKAQAQQLTEAHGTFLPVTVRGEEDAHAMAERLILTKGFYHTWVEAESVAGLAGGLEGIDWDAPSLAGCLTGSFKFKVEAVGRVISHAEQLQIIQALEPSLGFRGKVDLKTPEHVFCILLDYGAPKSIHVDSEGRKMVGSFDSQDTAAPFPYDPEEPPQRVYFARLVATTDRKSVLGKYSLKQRKYLGPTSMDAELALIMANMGKVGKGKLVWDPFVGTGSVLVAASHFGASCVGSDIDHKVTTSLGPELNMNTNMAQYGLEPVVDVVRADNAQRAWGSRCLFDAIVCDPPYGVRAGAKRVGVKEGVTAASPTAGLEKSHIPQTVGLNMAEVLRGLLEVAAAVLVVGGRLVYWLPISDEQNIEDVLGVLPTHPALAFVACSEQVLTLNFQRHLVTMEKVAECGVEDCAVVPEVHSMELKVGHHADFSCTAETRLVSKTAQKKAARKALKQQRRAEQKQSSESAGPEGAEPEN
eukprot:TRINITY_DN60205_c0_g1_i1.p1 TRINITY_DN60205_c0_g1~~TRINITY_DN60205_c0_g1_i1.p1  ORF type:complete len:545 (-),score=141.29 TRINITY_DN60205_c0_g1_i1:173-1807(-)